MKKKAKFVVNTFYKIHPEDVQIFTDYVKPHLEKTRALEGCVFYTFSFDMLDPTIINLAEGWADQETIDIHLASENFQTALKGVLDNVRILDRHGLIYTISGEDEIIPEVAD
ncbi:putative quinol monooxygenase [Flavobacterium sp. FlaQc-47]|uniref:putative quinol monooxygenase n=1 Tax=Flavobacterium sp. FlaQc-47 TaxID=3374180 RepID=UPI003757AC23